jgi:hypothetical protein
LLIVLSVSACDALPFGASPTAAPPSEAGVAEVGYLSKVIFDVPNAAAGDYRAVVSGVEYSCRTYEEYPDQLFCFGPELPPGEHEAQIYSGDEETPVFTLTVTVSGNEMVVTATPLPATPTLAPTDTPEPTPTLAVTLPVTDTQGAPAAPGQPTATQAFPTSPPPTPAEAVSPTLSPDEAVKVFYFDLDEKGRYGCGEAMYWVKTTYRISDNMANNIYYGLHTLFIYHQKKFGELYNPYGASNNQFALGNVEISAEGVTKVYLTGTYENSGDPCDPVRLKDQIYAIVRQFKGVTSAYVYLNGTILEDALARK